MIEENHSVKYLKKRIIHGTAEYYDQFPEHVRQLYRINYGYFRVTVGLGLVLGMGLRFGLGIGLG